MEPTACEKLGQLFAGLYGGYALLLLLAFPFHLLVAAALALRLLRPRFGWPCAHLAVDLVYGLLNPGLYLLVFDRLFGTFAPYTAEPTFGVVGEESPVLPLEANVAPWRALFRVVGRERTLRGKVRALFVRVRAAEGD